MKHTKQALFHSIVALILCCSMLVGTTFAWFTDEVTSGVNKIQAGNLDIELEYLDGGDWKPVKSDKSVFPEGILWEPGHTEVVYLRIVNKGNLALKYQLGIGVEGETLSVTESGEVIQLSKYIHFGAVDGVSVPFADRDAARAAVTESKALTAGYTKTGTMTATNETAYMALVVYMPESVGNEANHATGADAPSIDLGIRLLATQLNSEMDSFGSEYDVNAQWPVQNGIWTTSAPVSVSNGTVSTETTVGGANDLFTAKVPAGVKVNDGTDAMSLTVSTKTGNKADVKLEAGQVGLSLDVHMDGVAKDNTVPMTINLGKIAPTGLYDGNIKLYHVEGDQTITMTKVATLAELDAHNEFYYDAQTGEVFLSMASFSEVYAAVAFNNPWNGKDVSFDWYTNPDADTFVLDSAADLFGFAQVVGGMMDQTRNSFEGKTVKLGANINLGGHIWYPIGYYNSDGTYGKTGTAITSDLYAFMGTFDGCGYTIANFYQNTWEMKGSNSHYAAAEQYYNDGMGLFGLIENGKVMNLVVDGMVAEGEFTDIGCVTSYARGTCEFDNIRIANSSCYSYNCRTAGVVAYDWVGSEPSELTFSNIEIDPTNTFGALWGSWDVACAGILGYMNDTSTVTFTNCEVGCELDVFNDVCANYQYYDYRYAGMMIGTVGKDGDTSDMPGSITFANCTIHYRDWVNHYHCELVVNSPASYTHDYQMSRLVKISNLAEIQNADGSWKMAGNFVILGATEADHKCYHIMKDAEGKLYQHKHENSGNETIDGQEVLKEDKQIVHTVFNQIYTGYGWGAISVAPGTTVTEAKYTITYINDGKVLDVTYVTDNSNSVSTKHDDAAAIAKTQMGSGYEFSHWMNAGSTKIESVLANNTTDIVLYPSFAGIYTATFVDLNGNILAWDTYTRNSYSNVQGKEVTAPAVDDCEFDYWEVRISKNGTVTKAKLSEYSFADNVDITIYPVYTYNGDVNLIPVDNNGDGIIDEYHVGGYSNPNGQAMVEIPESVNGIKITAIQANAFASYDGVHSIVVPNGVEIGKNAFTSGSKFGSGEEITIYFDGTKEQWNQLAKEDGWNYGIGTNSRVFFLKDGKVDTTQGYLEVKNNAWNEKTDFASVKGQYIGACNCKESTIGDNAHVYKDADGNIMKHNAEGTPVGNNGNIIEYKWVWSKFSNKLTDGDDHDYERYRPDADYWN